MTLVIAICSSSPIVLQSLALYLYHPLDIFMKTTVWTQLMP